MALKVYINTLHTCMHQYLAFQALGSLTKAAADCLIFIMQVTYNYVIFVVGIVIQVIYYNFYAHHINKNKKISAYYSIQ